MYRKAIMQDLKKLIFSTVQIHLMNKETLHFEQFIDHVVADVFLELRKTFQIPMGSSLSDLKDELKEEVIESTRKRIYGYHDIAHYKAKKS